MPGLFDMLMAVTGRPTDAQLMAGLGQAPGMPGSNAPGPVPGAAPAPAGQAGGGAPQTQQGAPPAAQGPPGGPGGPSAPTMGNGQPAPNAFASPSDLSQMYLSMAQRAQAERGFNSGLAMLAAGLYPGRTPGGAAGLANAMNAGVQDPSELFGNLMRLQTFGQQAQQLQAFYRAAPDIAKQMNLTPDEVLAAGPTAINAAVQANLPPEAMRNWTFAKKQWIAAHPEDPTGAEFERQFPMSLAITGAIPGLSDTDRQRVNMLGDWQRQNPGQTPPTWLTNTFAFQNYQKDLGDAQGNFAAFNQKSQETLDAIDRVKNNPKLGSALTLLSTTGGIGSNFLSQYGALDPNTKKAIDDIQLLSGQVYGDAFRSTGSRRTQQEVAAITEGLSKLGKTGYSADDYKNIVLQPIQNRIQEGMANNYGAAQQLDSMPDRFKPLVNSIYLPGGSLYGGQGGDWARQPNRGVKQPSGGGGAPAAAGGGPADFSKMSSADADAAYEKLPSGAVFVDTDGRQKRKP